MELIKTKENDATLIACLNEETQNVEITNTIQKIQFRVFKDFIIYIVFRTSATFIILKLFLHYFRNGPVSKGNIVGKINISLLKCISAAGSALKTLHIFVFHAFFEN